MGMRSGILLALLALAALLACEGIEIPADRMQYVGVWEGESMLLRITPDGMVSYKRIEDGFTKELNAPIQAFHGDDFVVGVGPLNTTFQVDRPPYADGEAWKFVVDGVELVRRGSCCSHSI